MHEHGTWLHWLYYYEILPHSIPEMVPETILVVILLSIMAITASRKLRTRNPGRFQVFLEFVVSSLDNFVRGIVGHEAKTLTPIIGTLFIFILVLDYLGILPGMTSPTANINTPASLAIFAFVLVQVMGITRKGFVGYFKHFLDGPWWLWWLMIPIHMMGELAKPLSLTVRLFGNIFGEDMVIAVLILIVTQVLYPIAFPIQFPMMLFALFGGFVQALVFSMLTAIYVAVAIGGEEH